jgi:hypothetical protein
MREVTLGWELAILFLGLPCAMLFGLIPRAPIPVLLFAAGVCCTALLRDPTFDRHRLWNAAGAFAHARAMLMVFAALALSLTAIVAWRAPGSLFDLVRTRPKLWLLVMVFYPLVSVYPQELVYRAFFFHRYAQLFPTAASRVIASAALFAFAHVFFPRPSVSMSLSFVGGLLFGQHYAQSGSLLLASLEHALFGQVVFTIGLGRFFYHGRRA